MKPITAAGFLVLLALGGCSEPAGPKTMRVWGDVTYDGKPVTDGTIDFIASDGSPPAQAPIKDGHYDLPASSGLLAEKTYRVEISSMAKTGKTVPNVMGDGAPTMEGLYNIIPKEYNIETTLNAAVSPDASKNKLDYSLKKGTVIPPPR